MIEVAVIVIAFVSSLIRAVLGFGGAVLAMPLLTLLLGLQLATPLVALMTFVTALLMGSLGIRQMEVRALWPFLLGSLLGLPAGVFLLRALPTDFLRIGLGVFLVLFGGYRFLRPKLRPTDHPLLGVGLGVLAGMVGSAYNTHGPVAVLYGTLRGWSPERFRATLQGYFVVTFALILAGHALAGLWTGALGKLFLLTLPAMVAAVYLGERLFRRIPARRFEALLNALLIALGALLVF